MNFMKLRKRYSTSSYVEINIGSLGYETDNDKYKLLIVVLYIIILRVSFCSDIWYCHILAYYLGNILAYYLDN